MNRFEIIKKSKAVFDGTNDVLKIVENFDNFSKTKKHNFIDESFYNLMLYCYENIPYYQQLLDERSLKPKDFTSIKSIHKIPILTKKILREKSHLLRPKNLSSLSFSKRRSGGTTGEPIESLISHKAKAFEIFSFYKGLQWTGWNPNMKLVKLMGGSLGLTSKFSIRQKIDQFARNSIHIPAFFINDENIFNYHNQLSKYQNICILGYPSAISNFADILKNNNLYLNNVNLALATSEHLSLDWSNNIKDFFNCNLRCYYGMGEILSIGYQLESHDESYKIPNEHVYVESEVETSEILITQLHNIAQPLIRYKPGDLVELDNNNYPQFINQLKGRSADYFLRKNGTKVSPIFGTYSIQFSGVKVSKYQYVQRLDGKIEFRYEMNSGKLEENEKKKIIKIVENVMQEKVDVIFKENEEFILGKSKKHRICVRL